MKRSLYMKILVPVDGSDNSNKALIHACDLAQNYKADLHIIYVVEKPTPLNLLDRKEYLELSREFGTKVLKRSADNAKSKDVESKSVIKEGNIAKVIIDYAKKERINLIVAGRRGLGRATRLLLGSVSSKLASSSPCSLLIVK